MLAKHTCYLILLMCSDFGFKRENLWSNNCVYDEKSGAIDPHTIPDCVDGGYYVRSRGYRKIPGDTCQGGVDYRFDPENMTCPASSMCSLYQLLLCI